MMSKVNMTISKQASKISIIIPAYNCETTISLVGAVIYRKILDGIKLLPKLLKG